jgi:lysophospholipase L1-like esterase
MDWYEEEVRTLEAKVRQRPATARYIAFYGSSTIRLWSSLEADFPHWPVLNLGFGGSTLEACAHFFTRTVIPLKPRELLLYAGDNDLGDGKLPEHVLAAFRRLVQLWQTELPGTKLWFLSIKPSPSRWNLFERIRLANRLIQEEIASIPAAQYLDLVPRMLGSNGQPRRELFAADGLHLSPAGYRVWAEAVQAVLPPMAPPSSSTFTEH